MYGDVYITRIQQYHLILIAFYSFTQLMKLKLRNVSQTVTIRTKEILESKVIYRNNLVQERKKG